MSGAPFDNSSLNKHLTCNHRLVHCVVSSFALTGGMGMSTREKRGLEMLPWVRIQIYRSPKSWFKGKEAKQTYKREMGKTGRPVGLWTSSYVTHRFPEDERAPFRLEVL